MPGVQVNINSPTGSPMATVFTDDDGFYMYQYKHAGKEATYSVSLPLYGLSEDVPLKANKFVIVNFEVP